MVLIQQLKSARLFQDWNMSALVDLAAAAEEVNVFSNEMIFRQSNPGHALYMVVSGGVVLLEEVANGEMRAVSEVPAGSVFGEVPFLDHGLNDVSAQAREETTLIRIPYECLERISATYVDEALKLSKELGRAVAKKLRGSELQIAGLKYIEPVEPTLTNIIPLRRVA